MCFIVQGKNNEATNNNNSLELSILCSSIQWTYYDVCHMDMTRFFLNNMAI